MIPDIVTRNFEYCVKPSTFFSEKKCRKKKEQRNIPLWEFFVAIGRTLFSPVRLWGTIFPDAADFDRFRRGDVVKYVRDNQYEMVKNRKEVKICSKTAVR